MASNATSTALETDLTVAAIVERDGRFLCVEEYSSSGGIMLSLPGGHLESGETPEAALRREVLEETRLDFEPRLFVGAYLWLHANRPQRNLQLIFAGDAPGVPDGRAYDTGIIANHWLSRDELATSDIRLRAPILLQAIDDFRHGFYDQIRGAHGEDLRRVTDALMRVHTTQ